MPPCSLNTKKMNAGGFYQMQNIRGKSGGQIYYINLGLANFQTLNERWKVYTWPREKETNLLKKLVAN